MSTPLPPLRLALIGYGKMGKEIELLASGRGVEVTARVDAGAPVLNATGVLSADVAVHFAVPSTVLRHVGELAAMRKPVVLGTTGWKKDSDAIRTIVQTSGIGLVHASNFSVGVNIVYRLLREAGSLFDRFSEYDVSVHEMHHKDKVDAPSGTALSIADILLSRIHRKQEILAGAPEAKIGPAQLQITSTRLGAVVGTHRVTFDSPADSIEIVHTAKNRSGFALGALVAAEWVRHRKGMFTFEDVLADIFHRQ